VVLAKIISFSKVKLVFTEHSTSNRRIQKKGFKHIDKFFYEKYYQIICISQEVLEVVHKHTSLPFSKFIVITNGVDIEKFKNAVSISTDIFFNNHLTNKLLIQVSSFQFPKDQPTLIKSLQYLPSNVKLLLVGDGNLRRDCENLACELHLNDRVLFLGLRMDVPQLLKMADIIVLSSKYEGLSLSSMEGMASGRPFVASNVAGLRDVVKDAGVLFEQGNAKDLAEKINHLLENKAFYKETVNNCLIRAAQYDISYMVVKHIELYQSLK